MENTYQAFCLDEAIIYFGDQLEAELEHVAKDAKTDKVAEGRQKLVLEKWLGLGMYDPKNKTTSTGFANPVATR